LAVSGAEVVGWGVEGIWSVALAAAAEAAVWMVGAGVEAAVA
jgi:hypothetical protein